ncbi:M56 family metallopeptidase [Sporosarcina sp. Te-1]|uniref:M56 family metallopeptidase n=1 Tax=Sporosarcina sp. Te-1 TaxID=2818390 RepID=UPI001A9E35B0|nr:M56 family metallopeptidase [Sporosarcina sp. Te-1]QTD39797.1 M56 family metallopeptidase [Sporosarcina sp. Te-1]
MGKRQSSFILTVSLLISSIIVLQMGLYVTSIFAGCNMKFNMISICHSWLKAIGFSSLLYVLDGLVIYTLSFSLWRIGSQWIQMAKMKRHFQHYKEIELTKKMNQLYKQGKDRIIVLSHPSPTAFTMGFFHPKIIITTGLFHLLDQDELEAVIGHEVYHKENRDPLKVFLLSLGSSVMWYIPIQKWFYHQYKVVQEVLADEFAIRQQETVIHLGSALVKMVRAGKQEKMPFTYVSFAATAVDYRIESLLNPFQDIQLQLPLKIVFLSIIIFSIICGLFIYALA